MQAILDAVGVASYRVQSRYVDLELLPGHGMWVSRGKLRVRSENIEKQPPQSCCSFSTVDYYTIEAAGRGRLNLGSAGEHVAVVIVDRPGWKCRCDSLVAYTEGLTVTRSGGFATCVGQGLLCISFRGSCRLKEVQEGLPLEINKRDLVACALSLEQTKLSSGLLGLVGPSRLRLSGRGKVYFLPDESQYLPSHGASIGVDPLTRSKSESRTSLRSSQTRGSALRYEAPIKRNKIGPEPSPAL
eukprot:TRINITY_DN4726_c0_g1_i1.p1 TRINITY_DN4726_c0_g1~~TRINITY_DN4726_c0_g1_i1.p1  ORF type:complete len:256 (-),score=10.81 TRINITY_DN4726_c0_g1_i1:791-1519(-)